MNINVTFHDAVVSSSYGCHDSNYEQVFGNEVSLNVWSQGGEREQDSSVCW